MKILWFTNTPSRAADLLGTKVYVGGWMPTIEKYISQKEDIQLGIAFYWNVKKITQYFKDGVTYFCIPNNNIYRKIINKLFNKIESESDIFYYLDIIKIFSPDLIHIYGTEQGFGLLIPEVKMPVVIWIQGNISVYNYKWKSAGLTKFDVIRYSSKKDLFLRDDFNYQAKRLEKVSEREKRIYKYCNYFIGRTDWDRRISKVLSPKRKYYHCDDMIREEFFSQEWNKKPEEVLKIISIMVDCIYKGVEVICECIQIINLQFNIKINWTIVGLSSNDIIIKLLKNKYRDKKIWTNIKLLGLIPPEKIITNLSDSDIFVHPSHIENAPNSVDEAMLLGMPVITTFAGGTSSLISEKEGILIQDGDPFSLAGAILDLKDNYEFAKELGKCARIRAINRHKPEKILNDLYTIYKYVISDYYQEK